MKLITSAKKFVFWNKGLDYMTKRPTHFVSVIIPNRNQLNLLSKVLTALENQDIGFTFYQVIVIDDGSTDGSVSFVDEFSQKTKMDFHWLRLNAHNAGLARNRGVLSAKGDLLIFLDADTIPQNNLVSGHLDFHLKRDFDNSVLMGAIQISPDLDKPEQARYYVYNLNGDHTGNHPVNWWYYRTANTSLKKALFDQLGGFKTSLSALEDSELAYRLSQKGVQFYHKASVRVVDDHIVSLQEYLEKGRKYGASIATWYIQTPELRYELARRYGVKAPVISRYKRIKYSIRNIVVNRYTIPIILRIAMAMRYMWRKLTRRFFICVYRYYIRKEFNKTLKKFDRVLQIY